MQVLMIIIHAFAAGPAVTSAMVSPAACVERAEAVAAQVRAGQAQGLVICIWPEEMTDAE